MVRIIADSTCDLSKELLDKYNIEIVPLHILLADKEFLDGKDISPDEIYRWSEDTNESPKTSAVSIKDVIDTMEPMINKGDDIISFCISTKMSTTSNVFRLAAEELEAIEKVAVIDSENLSTGIGLLVIEAAIMAQEGKTKDEIVKRIDELKANVRASFVVDTLVYLHRGGRCSSVSAIAGSMLRIHPMIIVKDGAMTVGKKYRGKMSSVLLDYVKDMEEDLKRAKKNRVFITHSGCSQDVIDKVNDYLKELGYFEEILITRAGGVISSHCGPGTLGVLYISE